VFDSLDATSNRDLGCVTKIGKCFEPVRRDGAIIIRDHDGRTFGLFQTRIERVPLADCRGRYLRRSAPNDFSLQSFVVLALINKPPAQDWDAYFAGWTTVSTTKRRDRAQTVPISAGGHLSQLGAHRCHLLSNAKGCICTGPPCNIGRSSARDLPGQLRGSIGASKLA
jgi:hypothetical protein